MNGFVPTLVAVALAEIGWRADRLGSSRRPAVVAAIVIVLIAAAATAGALATHALTEWATALMVALALGFAAGGQIAGVRAPGSLVATLGTFWGGGTPLLAFAMAAHFGAGSVVPGTVAGLGGALVVTRVLKVNDIADRWPRRAAALVLAVAGAVVAVNALRLTG